MTRTEKCTLLRLLYKNIAEENNIVFLSARCDQDCECSGYCRKLHAELDWLFAELDRIGLSECTVSARKLYEQIGQGLAYPENFDPNALFFVERKFSDDDWDDHAASLTLSEDASPLVENANDTESP